MDILTYVSFVHVNHINFLFNRYAYDDDDESYRFEILYRHLRLHTATRFVPRSTTVSRRTTTLRLEPSHFSNNPSILFFIFIIVAHRQLSFE